MKKVLGYAVLLGYAVPSRYAVLVTLGVALISGCAPGLEKELPISRFPAPESVISQKVGRGRVLVRSFMDERSDHAVAVVDGRSVAPASDVPAAVRAATESYLKQAGFGIGGSDSPALAGSVQRWMVTVKPGFPTTVADSAATLGIEVFAPSGAPLFRGTYRGEYSAEHPLMDEAKIADALAQAMSAAIQQALDDPRCIRALEGQRP